MLIDGTKLADETLDGIKRYVVELLRAFRDDEIAREFDIDVLVGHDVHPLVKLPAAWLSSRRGSVSMADQTSAATAPDWRQRALHAIGVCIPPFLLRPLRSLIPGKVSRQVLGKDKSELHLPEPWTPQRNLLAYLTPPIVAHLAQKLLPPRIVLRLWIRGVFQLAPRAVKVDGYDLIHVTLPNNAHYFPISTVPTLITVHDLSHIDCPQYQSRANRVTLALGMERAARSGSHFVAVSHATRERVLDAYTVPADRIATVHSGCNNVDFRPQEDPDQRDRVLEKYGIPEGRYLLTLSTLEPRKNMAATVEAFGHAITESGRDDMSLVIAGARGWKNRDLERLMSRPVTRAHRIGYVDNEDLATLYSAATAFVLVSHYEGFGFPLLEAMSCGTAVIYGDNSSMPEIVGDAGLPADSTDTDAIARQILRLIEDEELAASLGRAGLRRAAEFSWKAAAAGTLEQYRRATRPDGRP